jgi:2-polyprenyl-3-methyl-5-hydroxy-6-metoxy-1,4-benzoquinol methylase
LFSILKKVFKKNFQDANKSITIDFKDDPDYIYDAFESALRAADFIYFEEYFKSKRNMLASTFFLEKYKDFIEEWRITSGGLFVKTNEKAKKLKKNLSDYSYKELESFYDENYYLNDCGGYESFKLNNDVLDSRLYVVQCLAAIKSVNVKGEIGSSLDGAGSGSGCERAGDNVVEKILDLGCGRGELSYAMAKGGADVLAIDYSAASIKIAEKNFGGKLDNLKYKKIDFFELDPALIFDKIVASDLVEHIDTELFGRFLKSINAHLNKGGIFILHTAPNKYVYSYKYKKDRAKAEKLGLYLPENPRSFYESLMHINEQTPGSLKRALKKYFKNICVWTANTEEPAGDLIKKPSKDSLSANRSIFALASNDDNIEGGAVIKKDIINLLTQNELKDISGISLEFLTDYAYAKKIKKNSIYTFKFNLVNNGVTALKSLGKNPISLSYHIKDANGNYIVYDGIRTGLPSVIYPKQTAKVDIAVQFPISSYTGKAFIEFTMLQEGVFWFENKKADFAKRLEVEII